MERRGLMKRGASVRASWLVLCIATAILTVAVPAAAQSPQCLATINGTIGPGAAYEIAMPAGAWNGELVVYAHGIDPGTPIALPARIGALCDEVTSEGFAFIHSSYSEGGYAVKDGMQRTHQLRGIFASRVSQPSRVYLVGSSLGGLISLMLAERFPGQYDGALVLSGLNGGGLVETTYVCDAGVLFTYFFPGVLPFPLFNVPPGVDFTTGGPTYNAVLGALVTGLLSPGQPTLQFASTAKLPALGASEIVMAGMYIVGFDVTYGNNLMDLTNGHMPYDNSLTVYSGSANDAALNAGVARYVADPSAVDYMEHYYTPTGDLRIPVLALHTTRDPIVPIFHEPMYADAVQAAGASQYLLQGSVDRFGHGNFTAGEVANAFFALVEWVRTGVKPQI